MLCPRLSHIKHLSLLHSDVWGPSPGVSVSGFRYYVSFVDDFSKYTWIFPLVSNSDVSSVIRTFVPFAENMLSCTLKIFRSDGGGEFVNKSLYEYFS